MQRVELTTSLVLLVLLLVRGQTTQHWVSRAGFVHIAALALLLMGYFT